MTPLRIVRKSMGEILIERKIITREQLDIALDEHKHKGGYLSQHLIALGFATELDIAVCLSNQYNFAYLPLSNYSIPTDILNIIPLKWIRIYTLLPVDRLGNVLSVSMADPLNEGVIQMLHQITNCEIQVFISTYSELSDAINAYFGVQLKDFKDAYLDTQDLGKIKTSDEFIRTKSYGGQERRQYVRVNKELEISYYFHEKTFKAKTKNISYGGIFFISSSFIPVDTDLACKIFLKEKQPPIDVVINILRIQSRAEGDAETGEEKPGEGYDVVGIFDFITSEDRTLLVSFLKENIP